MKPIMNTEFLKNLVYGKYDLTKYKPSKNELKLQVKTKLKISLLPENRVQIALLLQDNTEIASYFIGDFYAGDTVTVENLSFISDFKVS